MKLYDGLGPNPRLVRMFIAEKKLDIASEVVDLMAGANRREAYTSKNAYGQLRSLELDDGRVISETVVICQYLDELHPEPPLIGLGQKLDPANRNLSAWFVRMAARPSAAASAQPRS